MAAISDANFMQIVGYPENIVVASKAAQNDYLLFHQDPMVLIQNAYSDAGGVETFTHALITTASIDELVTAVAYSGGTGIPRLEGDYFLKIEHEIVHVKGDTDNTAATGTLTIVRGALGTTAAAHESGSAYIQNAIKLTGSNTGDVKILYKGIPAFRDGLNLSAADARTWSDVNPNRIYGSDYPTPT